MKEFSPKVSIVIPVYNGSNYLGEAIDSALAQTYKNIEIVVVNDGSNDDGATEKVAKSYGEKIRYFAKENGGVATALNLGIKKMKGEYFSWLSHDDVFKTYKIEKQIKFLASLENKKVILYSNYDLIDENGGRTGKCKFNHKLLEKIPAYGLLRGNVNGITMLIPKTAFDEHGEFDVSLRCTQDYDMWYRMMQTFKFVHIDEILSTTRIHSQQDTQVSPRVIIEGNALWIDMVEKLPDEEKIRAEGSLLRFYLEMIKFTRQTPYSGAVEHYEQRLIEIAQTQEAATTGLNNAVAAREVYEALINEHQKKAAAYYLENVIKQMVTAGNMTDASNILVGKLVGIEVGLSEKTVEKLYLSKVGKASKKPRIMFSSGHWLTGGMERVMSILFSHLKDDYELFLLTAYDGRESKISLPDYVTHIKISNDIFYQSFDTVALGHALILDIDIAVGFMNLFEGQLSFYELCADTRIKTVASNHEIYFYPYSNPIFYDLIQKRLSSYDGVDAVLWLTNNSAATYGLAASNSYLMPNPNSYKVQPRSPKSKEKIVLCVGRFNDHIKRVDRMLKIFSIVSKVHPDAKLLLVGKYDMNAQVLPNDERTLAEFVSELNIDKRKIEFIGEVSNVEDYYKKASVLLLTSVSEGFGMVINEAASFGVPSVCNKIPGLEDLVNHGENGFLVGQDDIEAAASAVNEILENDELRDTLGDNAKRLVLRFEEDSISEKWKFLFSELLSNAGDLSSRLNRHLAYKVVNQEDFSKSLFTELNKVIEVTHEDRLRLLNPKYESTVSFVAKRAKNKYARLNKSLKAKGALSTGKIIAKKTYHKAKRLYARP